MEVIVKANGGLGNRMRVISSCLALHEQLNVDIQLVWERNEALNCGVNDLFELPAYIKVKELSYIPKWKRWALSRRKNSLRLRAQEADCRLEDAEVRQIKTMKSDFVKLIRSFDSVFIDTCERFYGDPSYVASIVATPAILDAVAERALPRRFTAVHIRRGDHEASRTHSPFEGFVEQLDALFAADRASKVLLCSDDLKVIAQLRDRYGEQILHFAGPLKRNKAAAIQHALVDLLSMSKAERVIGSYWSSFSEEAAYRGGIELEIVQKKSGRPRTATP